MTNVKPRSARATRKNPEAVLEALRAQGNQAQALTPPTTTEAATMAIRGPWATSETLAVVGPWALVFLGMILLAVGTVTVVLVLVTQTVAAVVTTGAVLATRYHRRRRGRE